MTSVFFFKIMFLKHVTIEEWNESKAQLLYFPLGEGVRLVSHDKALEVYLKTFLKNK